MPITYPIQQPIPTVVRQGVNQLITPDWQSTYNFMVVGVAEITLEMAGTVFMPNAEIIIRNDKDSQARIKVLPGPFEFDISEDLPGGLIPPGGIMELRRVGASALWSVYGYIL